MDWFQAPAKRLGMKTSSTKVGVVEGVETWEWLVVIVVIVLKEVCNDCWQVWSKAKILLTFI